MEAKSLGSAHCPTSAILLLLAALPFTSHLSELLLFWAGSSKKHVAPALSLFLAKIYIVIFISSLSFESFHSQLEMWGGLSVLWRHCTSSCCQSLPLLISVHPKCPAQERTGEHSQARVHPVVQPYLPQKRAMNGVGVGLCGQSFIFKAQSLPPTAAWCR